MLLYRLGMGVPLMRTDQVRYRCCVTKGTHLSRENIKFDGLSLSGRRVFCSKIVLQYILSSQYIHGLSKDFLDVVGPE